MNQDKEENSSSDKMGGTLDEKLMELKGKQDQINNQKLIIGSFVVCFVLVFIGNSIGLYCHTKATYLFDNYSGFTGMFRQFFDGELDAQEKYQNLIYWAKAGGIVAFIGLIISLSATIGFALEGFSKKAVGEKLFILITAIIFLVWVPEHLFFHSIKSNFEIILSAFLYSLMILTKFISGGLILVFIPQLLSHSWKYFLKGNS